MNLNRKGPSLIGRSKFQKQENLNIYNIILDLRYATTIKRPEMLKITKRKLEIIEEKFSITRPVVNFTSIMMRVMVVRRSKLNNMKNHETKAKLGLQSDQYERKSLLGIIL